MNTRLHASILLLCSEARSLAETGERALALARYLDAWQLIPEPKDAPVAAEVRAGIRKLVQGTAALERAADVILRETPRRRIIAQA